MKILLLSLTLILPGIYRLLSSGMQDDIQKSIERGKEVYGLNCLGCHQENGEGTAGVYPPLAHTDFLVKDQTSSISIILKGQNESIVVNGVKYSVPMPSFNQLTDEQIADVLNYIGNSWENQFNAVTPGQVKSIRDL